MCTSSFALPFVAYVFSNTMDDGIMLPVSVKFIPEWSGVLQWLGVVIVVSIAACAWPASRATRIPTAAALAYE